MYILLSSAQHEAVITLEEPDDCARFHVAIYLSFRRRGAGGVSTGRCRHAR